MPEQPPPSGRYANRIGCAVLLAIPLWLAYSAWSALEKVNDCYALWSAADLVVEHLDHGDGSWPRSWDDLRAAHEFSQRPGLFPFDGIRARVAIDWQADPLLLRAALDDGKNPPFRAIWLRGGGRHHWGAAEPNRIVREYLRRLPCGSTDVPR